MSPPILSAETRPSGLAARSTAVERLDRAGMIAAGVCAVHCALTPLLLIAMPAALIGALVSPRTEWLFVGLSLCIGVISLGYSCVRRHRHPAPLAVFTVGFVILLAARTVGERAGFELFGVLVAAVLFTTAHQFNRHLCRHCDCCASPPGET